MDVIAKSARLGHTDRPLWEFSGLTPGFYGVQVDHLGPSGAVNGWVEVVGSVGGAEVHEAGPLVERGELHAGGLVWVYAEAVEVYVRPGYGGAIPTGEDFRVVLVGPSAVPGLRAEPPARWQILADSTTVIGTVQECDAIGVDDSVPVPVWATDIEWSASASWSTSGAPYSGISLWARQRGTSSWYKLSSTIYPPGGVSGQWEYGGMTTWPGSTYDAVGWALDSTLASDQKVEAVLRPVGPRV